MCVCVGNELVSCLFAYAFLSFDWFVDLLGMDSFVCFFFSFYYLRRGQLFVGRVQSESDPMAEIRRGLVGGWVG